LCQVHVSNVELKIIRLQPSPASITCPLLFLVNFCDKQLTQFPKPAFFSYSEIGNSPHKTVVYETSNVSFQLSCYIFNFFKGVFDKAPPERLHQKSRSRFERAIIKNGSFGKANGRAPPKEPELEQDRSPGKQALKPSS